MKSVYVMLAFLAIATTILPVDNAHFYRARFFNEEPRFAERYLKSLYVVTAGGKHSMYCDGVKYRLRIEETVFDFYTNFSRGIFMRFHAPVRTIKYKTTGAKKSTRQELHGFGDVTAGLGFALNYEDTEYFDYIDFTTQVGVLFPTGKRVHCHAVLQNCACLPSCIPGLGYDGHVGMPIECSGSLGLYDWFTAGIFAEVTPFFKHEGKRQGVLWGCGAFLKCDHLIYGLSCTINYGFDAQRHASQWGSWRMHTFNYIFEYDFATESHPYRPRINVFGNNALAGESILRTSVFGFGISVDIV